MRLNIFRVLALRALIVLALLFSPKALALGLGNIQVFSKHSEPLRAQINFLNSSEIERGKILVALATESDYNLARVERQPIHSELRFKLDYSGREPVVSVTTVSPIRVNFVKFLVQARWPQGKLLREYVIRLNPNNGIGSVPDEISAYNPKSNRNIPIISGGATLPPPPDVRLPGQADNSTLQRNYSVLDKYQAQQLNPQPASAQPAPAVSYPSPIVNNQWHVRKGETLWSIATIISRQLNTSVHKTVKALHQYNPNAFLNGNINSLNKNAVLQAPSVAQINAISLNTAVSSLNTPAVIPMIGNNLQLEAPDNSEQLKSIVSSSFNKSLDTIQEQFEKIRLENADVRNQMRELRNQVSNIESILEINNQEINKLSIGNSTILSLKNSGPEQYLLIATVALLVLLTVGIVWFLIYLAYQKVNSQKSTSISHTKKAQSELEKSAVTTEEETSKNPAWRQRLKEKRQNPQSADNSKEAPTPMLEIPVVTTQTRPASAVDDKEKVQIKYDFEQETRSNQAEKPDAFDQFISDDSEDSVQLELAKAYLDLGDTKGAEELLLEVLEIGTANQRRKAKLLLSQSS